MTPVRAADKMTTSSEMEAMDLVRVAYQPTGASQSLTVACRIQKIAQ